MNEKFLPGQLVRVVSPESIKEMNVVGIVTKISYMLHQRGVWIPDLSREIFFEIDQLELARGEG
jgi:ACT domain-containing protein